MHPFNSVSHINEFLKLTFALTDASILLKNKILLLLQPITYIYLTFDITFGLNATSAFRASQLLLKTEKGLHNETFAILCTINDTLFDLYKPLAHI